MTEKIKYKDPGAPGMQLNEKNGVLWLTYPQFSSHENILHGFSTRIGGVSTGDCATMNMSTTREDSRENVYENIRRIGECIGFVKEDLVLSDQTHTANVRVIKEEDRGCGITKPRGYHDVDGMITNVPGLVLATFYADCVPLFFVDPVHRAIGLSHSGWRGTVQQIGKVTLKKMREEYGTLPEDVLCGIGPSICQDCYEVSRDVIEAFSDVYTKEEQQQIFYEKPDGKFQLDLWKANRILLINSGIRPMHLSMPNICTCCNPDLLFSHRATGGRRGNLAAFLGIRRS